MSKSDQFWHELFNNFWQKHKGHVWNPSVSNREQMPTQLKPPIQSWKDMLLQAYNTQIQYAQSTMNRRRIRKEMERIIKSRNHTLCHFFIK